MSSDLSELADFFKDRVDELFLLQKNIVTEAEVLRQVSEKCISANESQVNKTILKMDTAARSLDRINEAAESLDAHMSFCAKHVKMAVILFYGSLLLALLTVSFSYFWYQHVAAQVDEAKLELAQANVALQDKPIFLAASNGRPGEQGDYVRIVPNTETTPTHTNGKPYPGTYAEVWTQQKNKDTRL